jgi:hypothetical protein
MKHPPEDPPNKKQQTCFFLAITLVIIVMIVIVTKDTATALVAVSFIANFFVINSQLGHLNERLQEEEAPPLWGGGGRKKATPAGPAALGGGYNHEGVEKGQHLRRPQEARGGEEPHRGPRAPAGGVYDGDELTVYQARARHDPERVVTDTRRARKPLVEYYVRDELDEQEARPWWGARET